MAEYFNIGKIVASFGVHGELILHQKTGKEIFSKEIPVLFIEEKKNSFIPYFVEYSRAKNPEEIYIKLEGIHSKEDASKLLQKQVYLTEEKFRKIISRGSVLYYLGFTVSDQTYGKIGEVAEVLEMPSQLLLKILREEKELLIPLHENTLISIDEKERMIFVKLPEGLLDIYNK